MVCMIPSVWVVHYAALCRHRNKSHRMCSIVVLHHTATTPGMIWIYFMIILLNTHLYHTHKHNATQDQWSNWVCEGEGRRHLICKDVCLAKQVKVLYLWIDSTNFPRAKFKEYIKKSPWHSYKLNGSERRYMFMRSTTKKMIT
jgi:hypothetical protein